MSEVILKADMRIGRGKGFNNKLRQTGFLPGVIYGKGTDGIAIQINLKELEQVLSSETGRNIIINLMLKNSKTKNKVMVRDIQRDAIRGDITHVDFYHISLKEKVHTVIPINLVGESPGVDNGGILQPGLRELEIECLPAKIPENIVVDISGLGIGDNLTVADINQAEEMRILSEPTAVVVSILVPKLADEVTIEKEEASKVELPKEEKELVNV